MTILKPNINHWLLSIKLAVLLAVSALAFWRTTLAGDQSSWLHTINIDHFAHLCYWSHFVPVGQYIPTLSHGSSLDWHQCGWIIYCHIYSR